MKYHFPTTAVGIATVVLSVGFTSLIIAGCQHQDILTPRPGDEPPTIIAMAPASDESFVEVQAPFTLRFSQAMDTQSVEEHFRVMHGGDSIPGTYMWNGLEDEVMFHPQFLLMGDQEYEMVLGPGMQDVFGQPLVHEDGLPFDDEVTIPCLAYETPTDFSSNGERIYFTATSGSGEPIRSEGGWMMARVHQPSCASCHGPDGQGGRWIGTEPSDLGMGGGMMGGGMMGGRHGMGHDWIQTPDIRYHTLIGEEHGDEAEHEEHPPYTDELIERAITEGLNPADEPLDEAMPRWSISESDLDDLVGYLKEL